MALQITICAVGKLKESFWVQACDEYLKRLKAYASVSVVEIADRDPQKSGGEAQAMDMEAQDILAAIPARAHVILLDIGGKEQSSEAFSHHLDELALQGTSTICFVIGGSTGVNQAVRQAAQERMSFGPITLPHNLARVVLLEQLYRAFKISRHEPYHK